MKNVIALAVGSVPFLGSGVASAQNGNMMNGGMSGGGWMSGYGGIWGPILLVVAIGLVAWVIMQERK